MNYLSLLIIGISTSLVEFWAYCDLAHYNKMSQLLDRYPKLLDNQIDLWILMQRDDYCLSKLFFPLVQ